MVPKKCDSSLEDGYSDLQAQNIRGMPMIYENQPDEPHLRLPIRETRLSLSNLPIYSLYELKNLY